MIESGSLLPGVDPAAFNLPAGTALRYERPAEPLRTLLPSYAVLDSDPAVWKGPGSWVLPGWPQMWIGLTDGVIAVQTRTRHYARLGSAVLYGGTSRAMPVTSRGGVTVVVDLSPMGWARWFDTAADAMRDEIRPLDQLWSRDWTQELVDRLYDSNRSTDVKPLLDDFFLSRLPSPHRHEPLLARITALLAEENTLAIEDAAARLDLGPRTLLRLCHHYFGYGPKMLIRRTRFLRVIAAMLLADKEPDHSTSPVGYHDVSHFLRDAAQFLGVTPRRFLALPMPYLRAALRARLMVVGAPLPLLDLATSDAG